MSTKRKTKKTKNAYSAWTHLRLALAARRLQKKIAAFANSKTVRTYQGMTPAQQRKKIQQELAKVYKFLRTKTNSSIDTKLKALKKQIAKRLNVPVSSPKATSPAIKRLTVKRRMLSKSNTVPTLVKFAAALKLASYKNPKVAKRVKARSTVRKAVRRTRAKARITRRITTGASTTQYKQLTQTLKKEIQRLKQRNTLMRKLVAKFRSEVNQMQRHYGTLNTAKPRLRVVSSKQVGKDVSNIIRFNNALKNAFPKQRKFG